jgi:hypothetical protein
VLAGRPPHTGAWIETSRRRSRPQPGTRRPPYGGVVSGRIIFYSGTVKYRLNAKHRDRKDVPMNVFG